MIYICIKVPWHYHLIPSLYHYSVPVKLHILRQCFKIRHDKKPYNTHRFECSKVMFRFTMVMSSLKADITALGWLQTAGACPLCLLLSQSSVERLRNSWTLLIDSYWHWAGCLFSALSQSVFPASFFLSFLLFIPPSVTRSFLLFGSYIFSSLSAPPQPLF